MAEENMQIEKLDEKKAVDETMKKEEKIKEDEEKEEKKIEKKVKEEEKINKKEEAKVKGSDLPISKKHAVAICRFIKNKTIENAVMQLEKVLKKKVVVPMTGEIPHRKNIRAGRYPLKASKIFIKLLKSLAANSLVSGLEKPYIYIAKADRASRPYRRFGSTRFKRTHVLLITREKEKIKTNKEEK